MAITDKDWNKLPLTAVYVRGPQLVEVRGAMYTVNIRANDKGVIVETETLCSNVKRKGPRVVIVSPKEDHP